MDADKLKMFDELSDNGKKEVLKKLELVHIYEATVERMKTDPEIQQYFEKYKKSSIDYFITSYANEKINLLSTFADLHIHNFNHEYKYRQLATEGLEQILSKKLLLKMCEWSAGLVELEGIETSDDFHYWVKNIFNCPFLEPVTQEELDIYAKYLKSKDYEKYDKIHIPYTYFIVKRNYDLNQHEDVEEPEFSILYDTLKGTSSYWLLPNIKIAQEERYKSISQKERVRKYYEDIEAGRIEAPKADERPSLDSSNAKQMDEYMRKFESADLLDKHRNKVKYIEDHIRKDANGNILPERYRGNPKDLTLEAMPSVFEDYIFRKENGLAFEINDEELKNAKDYISIGKSEIINARILLGEPGNLDIY